MILKFKVSDKLRLRVAYINDLRSATKRKVVSHTELSTIPDRLATANEMTEWLNSTSLTVSGLPH